MDDKIASDIAVALWKIAEALEAIDTKLDHVIGKEEFAPGRRTHFIRTGEILRET